MTERKNANHDLNKNKIQRIMREYNEDSMLDLREQQALAEIKECAARFRACRARMTAIRSELTASEPQPPSCINTQCQVQSGINKSGP
ncbi:hypothetical protein O181_007742 [Austropuccinia psidii MF-1]|uniref:Uncharacterized protein n=1 Tax=Austropuccinia psidii MF-1 TaxID=1389203 RepID=A0A9Q3GIS5_9BASI|nr:hypothetical protein [Austropuccinia psidii MF-1]